MRMVMPSPVLPRRWPDPYRPDVPRPTKHFLIDSVSVDPIEPKGYLSTGPTTAVPSRFEAHFVLGTPELSVTIEVFVGADLGPVVLDIAIRAKAHTPITTSTLRQVLIEQLLQRAVDEATVPAAFREEWLASLPVAAQAMTQRSDSTQEATLTGDERARRQFNKDAQTAAELWKAAVAAGSRRPGMAVAEQMNRSRTQVSRYIRRARALNLLPSIEPPEKA
jgi:hypothetical protein